MGQVPKSKSQISSKKLNRQRPYDLEERCFEFARDVALFCRKLPKTAENQEYGRQVIKASGSVGANYIEANESLSKKDFRMRVKICRKEAKESAYWLRLIAAVNSDSFSNEGQELRQEVIELKKNISAMLEKSSKTAD